MIAANLSGSAFAAAMPLALATTPSMPGSVAALIDVLRWAPSADNHQPWRFTWSGETVQARRIRRTAGLSSAGLMAETVGWGGFLEYGHQAAAAWCLPAPVGDADQLVIQLPEDDRGPIDTDLAGLLRSRSTRRGLYRQVRPPRCLLEAIPALRLPGAALRVVNTTEQPAVVRTVSVLSRLRFGLRPLHEDLVGALAPEGTDEGLPLSSLELPPGGATILRLLMPWKAMAVAGALGGHRLMSALETGPLLQAPALAILGASDDEAGTLACGRLLVRVWLAATRAGQAIHPYFLPGAMDSLLHHDCLRLRGAKVQACVDQALGCLAIGLPGGHRPRFLLRIGIPAHSAARSRRLPVGSLIRPAGGGA